MVRTPPLTIDPRALHIQRPPDEAEDRIVHRKSLLRVLYSAHLCYNLSSFVFHLSSSTFLPLHVLGCDLGCDLGLANNNESIPRPQPCPQTPASKRRLNERAATMSGRGLLIRLCMEKMNICHRLSS